MNRQLTSAIGGLAGAAVLTGLTKAMDKLDKKSPHIDLLSMNAIAKVVKGSGLKKALTGEPVKNALAGDLLSNSLYFGLAQGPDTRQTFVRGSLLGLVAGIGALALAKPLGLDTSAVEPDVKTKVFTVAWYLVGGLVAAAVIDLIDRKTSKITHG